MDANDRKAIEDLFRKIATVERDMGPRDLKAESYIGQHVARQPGAAYYMAQTIVMQDAALANMQRQIDEMQEQANEQPQQHSGGLFSRMFGGETRRHVPSAPPRSGAWGADGSRPSNFQRFDAQAQQNQGYGAGGPMGLRHGSGGGGGFLAGAAQTAMGVAGGMMLGNALAGMFSGDEAASAVASAVEAAPAAVEDAASDTGFFDGDFGGDEI